MGRPRIAKVMKKNKVGEFILPDTKTYKSIVVESM